MNAPRKPRGRDVLPATSRYEVLLKIAAGGMATVYVGRSRAKGGVTRLFAVKRAHTHLIDDPVFRKMFVAEARLASRIHHPNVVAVQDVEELDEELLLVMDYIEGLSLADLRVHLAQTSDRERIRLATRVVLDACAGLHAAHELRAEDGSAFEIVHRDVSPHNVLVGVDGIGRLTDFGIAKSTAHTGATATGGLKGKLGYMAPEYVNSGKADRRADVFGLGAVLWEALTGTRLFEAASEVEVMRRVLMADAPPPSKVGRGIPRALDAVVLKALAQAPDDRYPTALAFAEAIEAAARKADLLGTHREVGAAVEHAAHEPLRLRREAIRQSDDDGAVDAPASLPVDYAGPDRTRTLDPTVRAAEDLPEDGPSARSHGTPIWSETLQSESYAPRVIRSKAPAPVATRVAIVTLGAVTVVGGWFGLRHFAEERVERPLPSATSAPVVSALPTSAQAPDDAAAPFVPPAVVPPPVVTASAPPIESARPVDPPSTRPTHSPRPRPTPRPATSTEPGAPAHAPPNPYKKDAGR